MTPSPDVYLEKEYQEGRICKRCNQCQGLIFAEWKHCVNCGNKLK